MIVHLKLRDFDTSGPLIALFLMHPLHSERVRLRLEM